MKVKVGEAVAEVDYTDELQIDNLLHTKRLFFFFKKLLSKDRALIFHCNVDRVLRSNKTIWELLSPLKTMYIIKYRVSQVSRSSSVTFKSQAISNFLQQHRFNQRQANNLAHIQM